jgi:hypothetical protein
MQSLLEFLIIAALYKYLFRRAKTLLPYSLTISILVSKKKKLISIATYYFAFIFYFLFLKGLESPRIDSGQIRVNIT